MKTINEIPITTRECSKITTEIRRKRKKYDKLMRISLIVWPVSILPIVFSLWCIILFIIISIVFVVFLDKYFSIRLAEIMMVKTICDALKEGYTYKETLSLIHI